MVYKGDIIDMKKSVVMAIINVTTDSFYDGGSNLKERDLISNIEKQILQGATIIDIGACSTRPGAVRVEEDEEIKQIEWAVRVIKDSFPNIVLSLDTYRRAVAERALNIWGEIIVNDIYAGEHDGDMIDFVAHNSLPYIAMHYKDCDESRNTAEQVIDFFYDKLNYATSKGVKDFVVDVGFGFGKSVEQNFDLVREFDRFNIFGKPLLAGISRKSMIWRTLGVTPNESLAGTIALNSMLISKGANILRVHDSQPTMDTIRLIEKIT